MSTAENTEHLERTHLGALFFRRVEELGDRTFVRLQRGERFEEVSWRDFGAQVRDTILGLYSLGIARGERFAILSENRLEWLCADMATLAAGLPNVVVSPQLSESMILKILRHARCRGAFVENEAGVGRLLNLKGQLPSLVYIIVMDSPGSVLPHTLTLEDLLSRGRGRDNKRLCEILESVHPDDLASIMYTSGSTGEPKGVMRTQRNLLSNISNGGEIRLSRPDELCVIVLSLNHLLGRFGFLKSVATGRSIALVEGTELDLQIKVLENLSPTTMSLVPRVMEKIWNAILDLGENRKQWEQLETLEQLRAEKGGLNSDDNRRSGDLKRSLKQAMLRALGGRIKYISYSGAPMSPRIMRFFEIIGLPLLGSYGSTECGGVTLSGIGQTRPGSLGKPFANVEVRIAQDGEILVRGPTVTPGYFDNQEATHEVLDPDGWFHTGDLGEIDDDGSLRVTGRKKDLFYCSDGTNIYPGYIELLLENDRSIHQAILLGDRRPFIAALLVPDRVKIASALKKQTSALTDEDIETILESRVKQINARLERYEQIRKIVVMSGDFPPEVRSVTAFQKLKIDRTAVERWYRKEIDEIYPQPSGGEST